MGFIRNIYEAVYNNLIAGGAYVSIIKGAITTMVLFFAALFIGFVLGSLLTFLQVQKNKVLNQFGAICSFLFKGTPVYLALLLWYYCFLGEMHRGNLLIAIVVFSLYVCGHMADILVRNVDKEARRQTAAINERARKEFFQALLPFITEQSMFELKRLAQMLLQWTTVVGVIRVNDLAEVMTGIGQRTLAPFFSIFCAIILYLILQLLLEYLFAWGKKKLK